MAKNNNFVRVFIVLAVLGVGLLLLPDQATGGLKAIIASPWLTGSNGQTTTVTNQQGETTTTQTTLIPFGQVSFKMVLNATNEDGSAQILYERSTLPGLRWLTLDGLAVVKIGTKVIRYVDAAAVAAIALNQRLSDQATATFALNFTYCIQTVNVCTWHYREVTTPFLSNGTVALALMPTMRVLSTDVFPSTPSKNESRQVTWMLTAKVTVTDPKYPQLALVPFTGSTNALVTFNADGSITQGCTDCSGSSTIGGGITLTTGPTSTVRVTDPEPWNCVGNVCGGPIVPTGEGTHTGETATEGVTHPAGATAAATAAATTGTGFTTVTTVLQCDREGCTTQSQYLGKPKTVTKTPNREVKETAGTMHLEHVTSGGKQPAGGYLTWIVATQALNLEPVRIEYYSLFGDKVYLVNPIVLCLAAIVGGLFVVALLKKQK